MRIFSLKILLVLFCLLTCNLSILTSKARASELSYIHTDHLGSTSLVTDEQGNVISQQVYYPYGSTRQKLKAEGLKLTAREYTGQVSDQDQTGLYYYNARYYNPVLAKFNQADSIQGPNRYLYVSNNPIIRTDPSGHMDATDDFGGGGGMEEFIAAQEAREHRGSESQSSGGLMEKVMETEIVSNWLSLGAPMLGNTEAMQGFNYSEQEDRHAAKPLAIASAAIPAIYMGAVAIIGLSPVEVVIGGGTTGGVAAEIETELPQIARAWSQLSGTIDSWYKQAACHEVGHWLVGKIVGSKPYQLTSTSVTHENLLNGAITRIQTIATYYSGALGQMKGTFRTFGQVMENAESDLAALDQLGYTSQELRQGFILAREIINANLPEFDEMVAGVLYTMARDGPEALKLIMTD